MNTAKKLCFLIVVLFILSSCQPTPDEPIVMSKGNGMLQKKLHSDPEPTLTAPYSVPDKWTETIKGAEDSKLVISVDADISVPTALSYPVFSVTDAELSQDTADSFIKFWVGDEKLYDYGERAYSDEHLRAFIEKADYQLNDPTSPLHVYPDFQDEGVKGGAYEMVKSSAESWRDMALEQLAKPKDGIETSPTFDNASKTKDGLVLHTYNLDKNISLAVSASGRRVGYRPNGINCMGLAGTYVITNNLIDLTIEMSEAEKVASEALERLGYGDWNLVNVGAAGMVEESFMDILWDFDANRSIYDQPQGYLFTYTPAIYEDIPLLYYSNNDSLFFKNNFEISSGRYAPPLELQPSVQLAVFDDGIRMALLTGSMKITDTLNKNVSLLPFSEIQDIFRRYIVLNANFSYLDADFGGTFEDDNENGTETSDLLQTMINIDNVCLGYMKIREKDSSNHRLLLPVWMFYGTQHDKFNDSSEWLLDENNERIMDTPAGFAFLIINAIDGSIIDPLSGY